MDLLEILATHVQHRFVQANGGSTNTTRVHAFHDVTTEPSAAMTYLSVDEVQVYIQCLAWFYHD